MTRHRPVRSRAIPAVWMRGGTSKGVFFRADDLPSDPLLRDRLLLRVMGSPDPYGQQIDGLGGATSSTSKVVVLSRSSRPDSDVDYRFGAVAVQQPLIDWSGNCGNLSAAVGPQAIRLGLVANVPQDGIAWVRIWQVDIGRRILAGVPMQDGEVLEEGDFELDGVTFPAAEIELRFLDPGGEGTLLPTGALTNQLLVPGVGALEVTLLNAGIASVFVAAEALGLRGTESQAELNAQPQLLAQVEAVRAAAAVAMGLAATPAEATALRPHSPKLTVVAPPTASRSADGRSIPAEAVDVVARTFSMGKAHHAMTGTGAVALACAAAVPGTVVQRLAVLRQPGQLCVAHPSGSCKGACGSGLMSLQTLLHQREVAA
ncbi:2-methylaconitate cis-trans isomerase PrpF [Leptothrix ochracea]|uniref:2-methylaconitate cis-trans isomerase PrpF n=1 Tax=Leptothrix ochracea TaxID=735331 RepID=UPI0034E2ADEB